MNKRTQACPRQFIVRLSIVVAAAVIVSLLASYYTRHAVLRFDEKYYYAQAENITLGNWEDGYIVRAPLYPLFLAGIFSLFGTAFWPVLVVQSILRGITVAGVAMLGRRYLTERAGIIAGILVAVMPGMILNYTRFMTEVLYVPLFLLSYYLIERTLAGGRLGSAAEAGVLSGVAALVRSFSLAVTLLVTAWLLIGRGVKPKPFRRRIALAAVLVGALLVVLSPWTVRNALTNGGPILVSNDAAFNLWLVISGKDIKEVTPEWRTWGTQAERQAEAYRRWAAALGEDPTFHLRRIGRALPRLLKSHWMMPAGSLSTVRRDFGNRDVPALTAFLGVFTPVHFFLIIAGGIVGAFLVERDATRRNLLLLVFLCFLLVHAATLFRARFMLPVQMLLAVYAAGLIDRVLPRWGWTMQRPRRES